jgi:hypothetical protein
VTAGLAVTVKLLVLTPVPPGAVTAIVPVVAPDGTVTVICVERRLRSSPRRFSDPMPADCR